VRLAKLAAERAMVSRDDGNKGNSSYLQDAFGNKTSAEIAQLFSSGNSTSRGGSSIYDSHPRRPAMSSAITPHAYDRPFYETTQELDARRDVEPGCSEGLDYVVPRPYNERMSPELDEDVQASASASTDAVANLQSKAYKRRESYAADDFISTLGSPPMSSTPMPSPGRDIHQASSSFEVIQDSENIARPLSPHVTSPPAKKRKLAGVRRRKHADLQAPERADASSSKPEEISSSIQRPGGPSSWAVGSEQLVQDQIATQALSKNHTRPEKRDEYGRLLPDPETYAVGGTKFIDTA
jgi:hypothetical protein